MGIFLSHKVRRWCLSLRQRRLAKMRLGIYLVVLFSVLEHALPSHKLKSLFFSKVEVSIWMKLTSVSQVPESALSLYRCSLACHERQIMVLSLSLRLFVGQMLHKWFADVWLQDTWKRLLRDRGGYSPNQLCRWTVF